MPEDNPELTDIRKMIDEIDFQIHDLLNLRAKLALGIAEIKIKENQAVPNFHRPEREAQILKKITEYNQGPLPCKAIATIFKTIMEECRNLQIDQHPETKP